MLGRFLPVPVFTNWAVLTVHTIVVASHPIFLCQSSVNLAKKPHWQSIRNNVTVVCDFICTCSFIRDEQTHSQTITYVYDPFTSLSNQKQCPAYKETHKRQKDLRSITSEHFLHKIWSGFTSCCKDLCTVILPSLKLLSASTREK